MKRHVSRTVATATQTSCQLGHHETLKQLVPVVDWTTATATPFCMGRPRQLKINSTCRLQNAAVVLGLSSRDHIPRTGSSCTGQLGNWLTSHQRDPVQSGAVHGL